MIVIIIVAHAQIHWITAQRKLTKQCAQAQTKFEKLYTMDAVDFSESIKRLNIGDEKRHSKFRERSNNQLERGATAPLLNCDKKLEGETSDNSLISTIPEDSSAVRGSQTRKRVDMGDERRRKRFKERSKNLERGVSAPVLRQPSLCEDGAIDINCL